MTQSRKAHKVVHLKEVDNGFAVVSYHFDYQGHSTHRRELVYNTVDGLLDALRLFLQKEQVDED